MYMCPVLLSLDCDLKHTHTHSAVDKASDMRNSTQNPHRLSRRHKSCFFSLLTTNSTVSILQDVDMWSSCQPRPPSVIRSCDEQIHTQTQYRYPEPNLNENGSSNHNHIHQKKMKKKLAHFIRMHFVIDILAVVVSTS